MERERIDLAFFSNHFGFSFFFFVCFFFFLLALSTTRRLCGEFANRNKPKKSVDLCRMPVCLWFATVPHSSGCRAQPLLKSLRYSRLASTLPTPSHPRSTFQPHHQLPLHLLVSFIAFDKYETGRQPQ